MKAGELIVARVLDIPHVVDGDSLWARLEFSAGRTFDNREILERDYAGGSKVRLTRPDVSLDTPEKKDRIRWEHARQDVLFWVDMEKPLIRDGAFMLHAQVGKDPFCRYLGDLVGPNGSSLVAFMRARGWGGYRDQP